MIASVKELERSPITIQQMKSKPAPQNDVHLNTDPSTGSSCDHILIHRKRREHRRSSRSAEEELCNRIFREGNGRGLINFCRELSGIMMRQYSGEGDVGELRSRLESSLIATLRCSSLQAQCLIDLALELIHARIHGRYRRTEVELSYLIATATGAVSDVSSN